MRVKEIDSLNCSKSVQLGSSVTVDIAVDLYKSICISNVSPIIYQMVFLSFVNHLYML